VLFEGEIPEGSGYFLPVTIFDNPPEDSELVSEEPFGPVIPLLKVKSVEEAIERANSSPFGLAGSVWSSNPQEAMKVASQLETGNVFVNEPFYLSPFAAFGGHKQSGVGIENGLDGLLSFTNPLTIMLRRG